VSDQLLLCHCKRNETQNVPISGQQHSILRVMHTTYTAAFLLAALLASLPGARHSSRGIRLVAGQGLDVSADNLGAGAEATANEFEQFESALELATTGGRGRYAGRQLGNQLSAHVQFAGSHSWPRGHC
jgi:hypothetical protein